MDRSITIADIYNIDTGIAGDGLSGGDGTALSVNVDNSTVELSSDALRIKDLGVTNAKIANATITGAKIATGTITSTNLANGSVTASAIDSGAVGTDEIAAGAVTASRIASSTITSAQISSTAGIPRYMLALENSLSVGGGNASGTVISTSYTTLLSTTISPTSKFISIGTKSYDGTNPGYIQLYNSSGAGDKIAYFRIKINGAIVYITQVGGYMDASRYLRFPMNMLDTKCFISSTGAQTLTVEACGSDINLHVDIANTYVFVMHN